MGDTYLHFEPHMGQREKMPVGYYLEGVSYEDDQYRHRVGYYWCRDADDERGSIDRHKARAIKDAWQASLHPPLVLPQTGEA